MFQNQTDRIICASTVHFSAIFFCFFKKSGAKRFITLPGLVCNHAVFFHARKFVFGRGFFSVLKVCRQMLFTNPFPVLADPCFSSVSEMHRFISRPSKKEEPSIRFLQIMQISNNAQRWQQKRMKPLFDVWRHKKFHPAQKGTPIISISCRQNNSFQEKAGYRPVPS